MTPSELFTFILFLLPSVFLDKLLMFSNADPVV